VTAIAVSSRARSGGRERALDETRQELEVRARGELRHDAAIELMHVLGSDQVRAQLTRVREDRDRRVIARRLDPEHESRRLVHALSGASDSSSHAMYFGAPAAMRTATHSGVS
jgi:hypothetical protein